MSSEERDLALSELECSKTRMESSRELPSLNLTPRKTQIERAGLMERPWGAPTGDSESIPLPTSLLAADHLLITLTYISCSIIN